MEIGTPRRHVLIKNPLYYYYYQGIFDKYVNNFSTPIRFKNLHFDAKMLKFSSFILSKISITQKDFRSKATPS